MPHPFNGAAHLSARNCDIARLVAAHKKADLQRSRAFECAELAAFRGLMA